MDMLGKGLASLIPPKDDDLSGEVSGAQPQEAPQIEEAPQVLQDIPLEELPPEEVEEIRREEPAAMPTEASLAPEDEEPEEGEAVFHIEIDRISPNPYQPRREFHEEQLRELANSIREYGIIQPLVVSRAQKDKDSGAEVEYQLIAGERRFRASKLIGLQTVPCVVRRHETPKKNLELALIENLQRSDLNPIETARAYSRLQDEFVLTQREVAARVGKSREAVANTLRLLSLPSEIQDGVSSGKINESQARLLLSIEDVERQRQAFQQLLAGKMSVRMLREKIGASKKKEDDPEKKFYEKQLEEKMGAPVEISKRGEKGKVVIKFFSEDELQGLVGRILGDLE